MINPFHIFNFFIINKDINPFIQEWKPNQNNNISQPSQINRLPLNNNSNSLTKLMSKSPKKNK